MVEFVEPLRINSSATLGIQKSERKQTDFSILITDHKVGNKWKQLTWGQASIERGKALLEFLLDRL